MKALSLRPELDDGTKDKILDYMTIDELLDILEISPDELLSILEPQILDRLPEILDILNIEMIDDE